MFRDSSRSRLTLLALVAAAVVLLILDGRPGSDPVTGTARAGAELAFVPIAGGVSRVTEPVVTVYEGVRQGPEAAERIAELEEANTELESELRSARIDEGRAERLDDLLHLSGLGQYEIVPAQAITHVTSQGYEHTATLDVGTDSGVEKDMTVVNGQGLVGKVVQSGARTSTVRLVTDHNSSVGARLEDSGMIGVAGGARVPGAPDADLTYELFDMEAQIEPGDRIVTLGSHEDAPFVPGVPIGTVEEVHVSPGALSRVAAIEPAVDHAALDAVGVVVGGPAEDPRDSLLPPEPDPEGDR